MKKDYSDVMESLDGLKPHLLQVATYATFEERCIIILDQDPPDLLERLEPLQEYVQKRNLPFPLLVSRDFIISSLDSFPLEFLDIVSAEYTNLLAKEDLLKHLSFSIPDLRLQMEREVKSKWLLTRLSVLEQSLKPKAIANVLELSIHSLIPVLKGLCFVHQLQQSKTGEIRSILKKGMVPIELDQIISQATELTQIDLSFLMHWVELKKADVFIAKNYLEILSRFSTLLESWDK